MMFSKYKHLFKYQYSLANGLLGQTLWPYIWYRSRFFFINSCLKFILHFTELYFIFIFFSPASFHRLLIFRSIAFILYGAWWGMLELLREYARQAKRLKQLDKLSLEIFYWFFLTLFFLFIIDVFAILLLWPNLVNAHTSYSTAFHFYLIAILLQINLSFIVNVIHSGIYGISRVYRPLKTLLLPNILSFLIMILGWFIIGIYALPIAFIIASFLSLFLSLRYTIKMYILLGIKNKLAISRRSLVAFLNRVISWELVLNGLSSMLLTASGPLIIIIALFFRIQNWDYITFLYLYLIIPILQLNVEWVFLFYFDLNKLSKKPLALLVKRYHRAIYSFVLVITLFSWVLSIIACFLYIGKWLLVIWVLLPWFLLRGFLSYFQINAFVRRLYFDIIISGLFVLLSLFPFLDNRLNIFLSLTAIFIGFLIALLWLNKKRINRFRYKSEAKHAQPYYQWLNNLLAANKPVLFYRIELVRQVRYQQATTIITEVNRLMDLPIWFTFLNEYNLLGFQILESSAQRSLESYENIIILASAGLVKNLKVNKIQPADRKSLMAEIGDQHIETTQQEVINKFNQDFPEGIVFSIAENQPKLPNELYSQLLSGLQRYLEKPQAIGFYESHVVSALFQQGIATTLFIIDRKKVNDNKKIHAWLDWLFLVNNNSVFEPR